MEGSSRIEELRQKFHENPRRYFAPLANEYRKAGDPEQAIAICRAHLAQQPGHMSGHLVYGQALYDANRVVEARAILEKALSLDPENAIAMRYLGHIARGRGETTEARHWYARALDLDPHDSELAAYVAELTEPLTGVEEASAGTDAATAVDEGADAGVEVPAPGVEGESSAEPASEPASEPSADSEPSPDPEPSIELVSEDVETSDELPAAALPEVADTAGVDGEVVAVIEDTPLDITLDVDVAADADVEERTDTLPAGSGAEEGGSEEGATPEAGAGVEDARASEGVDEVVNAPVIGEDTPAFAAERENAPEQVPAPWVAEATTAEDRLDSPASEPSDEPQPVKPADVDPDDALWRKAPTAEEAPFITRTMAELYLEQGHREAALDVFRKLAELNPEDGEIQRRIEEITPSPPVSDQIESGAGYSESSADGFADSSSEAPGGARHFSDLELGEAGEGDAFEAGFVSHESFAPLLDSARAGSGILGGGDYGLEGDDTEAMWDELLKPDDTDAAPGPAGPASPSAPSAPVAPEASPAPFSSADEGEAEGAGVVAYSPEPPPPEELAHYAPHEVTVGEFFATLGARRPPAVPVEPSFTARAAIPEVAPRMTAADDLPLATDAFANLFPDTPVSEADTRAAFALSGAWSATTHAPGPVPLPVSPPREPLTPPPDVLPVEPVQESEEDLRRFREWLDGLSES